MALGQPLNQLEASLIATSGEELQVITLALDTLRQQSEPIDRVVVLHTTPKQPSVAESLAKIRSDFATDSYPVELELQTAQLETGVPPFANVDSREGAKAAYGGVYRALRAENPAARHVRLSLAGVTKTTAVFCIAAAQMLFDQDDHLWRLLSRDALRSEKRMHTQYGDHVALILIPVVLWNAIAPVFTDLREIDDPFATREYERNLQIKRRFAKATAFVTEVLSAAEAPVAELLVSQGLSNIAIAEALTLSPRTIERHIGEICSKAELHWGLANVTRTQLVALLSVYFTFKR